LTGACVTLPHLHLWLGFKQQQVVLQGKVDWPIQRPGKNGDKSYQKQIKVTGQVVDKGFIMQIRMGSLLSFYCQFFATQIIGGTKELVVLL